MAKGNILIVEDEWIVGKDMKRSLKNLTYSVRRLSLPGETGYDILKDLKKDRSGIPVVVLTANIQESVKKECLELGLKKVINKPTDSGALLKAVSEAIQSSTGVK